MCDLALARLDACNGQLSTAAVCSDRNCIVALSVALEKQQAECAGVAGFANMPTIERLGCNDDGTVMAADGERDLPA